MATPKEQFIAYLKQDIQNFDEHARRLEELIPHMANDQLREQWTKIAAARKAMAEELRLLLKLAESV